MVEQTDETVNSTKTIKIRLVGSFEGAIQGQQKYDAVSGASMSASINKNSNVQVQAAEVESPDSVVPESAWKPLNEVQNLYVDRKQFNIELSADSGMTASYNVHDSAITLAGVPKKVGKYPVKVNVKDAAGRIATSNILYFEVFGTDEKLVDYLKIENSRKMHDGKYIWDMNPWLIKHFTHDSSQTVTLPKDIKAWYGSNTSGVYGKLGEVKKYKEDKGTIICVGGCMMQQEHVSEKIKKSYPYVDVVFGIHTLDNFAKDLYLAVEEKRKIEDIIDVDGEVFEGIPNKRDDSVKASVLIMNGCNNFCTYCIVPYVRGRERSRRPEDIIAEVKALAKAGYKEITLLGQNVNSYMVAENRKGMKITNTDIHSFAELLAELDKIEGIERIRFTSPHPKDFTDDVIDVIANSNYICKLIHMPLQAGSSNVLKKMNRNYTKEEYLKLVDRIRAKIPNATFTTDIIVGFPGETDEDFEDTLDVVSKVRYEQIYMFIYSRRVGTVADTMENQIPEDVKHKRFDRLKKLTEEIISEDGNKYIGTIQKVLVEGVSKNNDDVLSGRTDSYKVVNFKGDKSLIGRMVDVKIDENHVWYLSGICDNI